MGIKFKTEIWEDKEKVINKLVLMLYMTGTITLVNIVYGLSKESWIIAGVNAYLLLCILGITLSKWQKEKRDYEKEHPKN